MGKLFLILIFFLFFVGGVSALTASSENYSVGRFGTGIQATNLNSDNLTGRAVSLTGASTRNAENSELTANIGFWANTSYHVSVSITSYSIYPESAVQGSIIKLSISALNSESVWAILTLPSGSHETITLTNNGDAYYTANSIGVYTVTFYANNSQGNLASVIDTFEITSPVIPPATPPSGGGGTTTIIEKCSYIWDCSAWSICSDGKQQRECKNLGNCTGTEGKPIETRECSDALFDVVISFKEVGLTSDGTLNFNVDLTETKGVEKIDVQIKYSIIDSENNEIFSQIETRAIQGNLIYEKEINEIKLINGEYTLRVDILYGNLQRAFAEQRFKVKDKRIEIEPASNIQKIMEFLKVNYIILLIPILVILIIILLIIIFRIKKKNSLKQELKHGLKLINKGYTTRAKSVYENIRRIYNPKEDTNKKMYHKIIEFYNKILKSKFLIFFIGIVGAIVLLFSLLKSNITGGVINNVSSSNKGIISISLIVISIIVLGIILRKKFVKLLSGVKNKNKKYSANSIRGLINKKVYSDNGNYIGEIKDVILGKNRIESLKIEIDKKHKFGKKGIVVNYKHVKSVSEIMIIEKTVTEHLEDYKNSGKI